MILKKYSRITAILFTLLLSVSLLFSSAVTVFAEGEQSSESFSSYAAEHNQELIDCGIIDEPLVNIFTNTIHSDEEKLACAKYLVEVLMVSKVGYKNTYTDDYIIATFEADTLEEIKQKRNNALAACKVEGADLIGKDYCALKNADDTYNESNYFVQLHTQLGSAFNEIDQVAVDAKNKFDNDVKDAIGRIDAVRNERKELAETEYKAGVDEFYTTYEAKIKELVYNAPTIGSLYDKLENLEKTATESIVNAPINAIEYAMVLYHDWLNSLENTNKYASEYDGIIKEKVDALTPAAEKAVSVYKSSVNKYASYNAEYKLLVAYIDNINADPNWTPVRVESIEDMHRVIKITAKDRNGNPIEAIPVNCKLRLFQTKNAAAQRNASLLLKEMDTKLSVAYFVSIWITIGSESVWSQDDINGNPNAYTDNWARKYELESEIVVYDENGDPVKDKYGNIVKEKVTYEVTFDVNKYYEKYLKESKGKLLLDNISDANKHLSELEVEGKKPALCYGYKTGNDNLVDLQKIELKEGGILVFNTTSHLNSFFLAGTGLESYLTSPLFWVVVLAAIILLIIVIKIIVKHCKYSIRFVTNGGSYVEKIRASKGEFFVLPTPPTKDGYVFAGWFTDKALTVRFIGNCMTRRKGFKLYAKWAAPVARDRLLKFYDVLRDTMCSYKKESFKSLLGLAETEFIASMAMKENYLQLNLALNPDVLRKEGVNFVTAKEKRYAEIPVQLNISTEEMFAQGLELTKRVLLNKGLQRIEDYVPAPASTEEERKRGFAFIIHNERVAKTAEDYFELLRIAVKSYVLENDLGKFKPGDKVTLARIYVTNEVACLHLPKIKGVKGLKPARKPQFADTPVLFKVLAPRDMLEAYALIDKVMKANGFVKRPENANDLVDVKVPATNGFAYTLVF